MDDVGDVVEVVDDVGTLDVGDVEVGGTVVLEATEAKDDTATVDVVTEGSATVVVDDVDVGATVDVVVLDVEVDVVVDDDVVVDEVVLVDGESVVVDTETGTLDDVVEPGGVVVDVDDEVDDVVVDDVLVDDVVVDDVVLVDGSDDASHSPGRPTVTDATGPANEGGTTNRGTPTAAATNTANRKRVPVTTGIKSSGHYYLSRARSNSRRWGARSQPPITRTKTRDPGALGSGISTMVAGVGFEPTTFGL